MILFYNLENWSVDFEFSIKKDFLSTLKEYPKTTIKILQYE